MAGLILIICMAAFLEAFNGSKWAIFMVGTLTLAYFIGIFACLLLYAVLFTVFCVGKALVS